MSDFDSFMVIARRYIPRTEAEAVYSGLQTMTQVTQQLHRAVAAADPTHGWPETTPGAIGGTQFEKDYYVREPGPVPRPATGGLGGLTVPRPEV